jgi:hypothetical protein
MLLRELGPILELLLSWIVTNALTFAVVILDERYLLKGERLERAWIPSSRDAAIIAFGIFALPVHFIKTRTSLSLYGIFVGLPIGFLLSIVALGIVIGVSTLVLNLLALVLGLPT